MTELPLYSLLVEKMADLALRHGLGTEEVNVYTDVLTPEQAIGRPERRDFPLLKGKEKMVEARIRQSTGQAFTNHPGSFRGKLADVLKLKLDNNYERAVFVATLNSLCRQVGLVENSRHCRDQGPADCANQVVAYLQDRYGRPRVGLVGLQPALAAALATALPLRVIDLDPENINSVREGVLVEDGETAAGDLMDWAQVLMVTGSTVVNGTIDFWLKAPKPAVFYGNTIAGTASLLGLARYCPCSV